jgi:hypothetical protein
MAARSLPEDFNVSFSDDLSEDPVVFTREATQIVFSGPDGEVIETIDLPALSIRRSEVCPEWLALHDREREEQEDPCHTPS